MFTYSSKKLDSIGYQFLTFDYFIFKFFAVFEITRIFPFSFLVIINGLYGEIRY